MVAAVRAQRGDGKEALVLVTPLRANGTLGLGVSLALARHLADVPWLSRDVLLLAADAGCVGGAHAAAEAWLADYHEEYSAFLPGAPPPPPAATFLRGGLLTTALVLDAPSEGFDALQLRMQGTQGALPNLDVVALLRALAGSTLLLHGDDWGGVEAGHVHTREHYAASVRAAARFMRRQARGVPDGCVRRERSAFAFTRADQLAHAAYTALSWTPLSMPPPSWQCALQAALTLCCAARMPRCDWARCWRGACAA